MEHLNRVRATKAQRRATKPAKPKDYAKMVLAASEVVMRNRNNPYRSGEPEYVLLEFPYWIKFTRGFPKGHIVKKTLNSNTYKVNAVKLLNWLYDNGYSEFNSSMLVKQTVSFEQLDARIERLFNDNF